MSPRCTLSGKVDPSWFLTYKLAGYFHEYGHEFGIGITRYI